MIDHVHVNIKSAEISMYWKNEKKILSLSRDLNTGPADYKSAALPTKPLRRHNNLTVLRKKDGVVHN
jgi:hypothetical protein